MTVQHITRTASAASHLLDDARDWRDAAANPDNADGDRMAATLEAEGLLRVWAHTIPVLPVRSDADIAAHVAALGWNARALADGVQGPESIEAAFAVAASVFAILGALQERGVDVDDLGRDILRTQLHDPRPVALRRPCEAPAAAAFAA